MMQWIWELLFPIIFRDSQIRRRLKPLASLLFFGALASSCSAAQVTSLSTDLIQPTGADDETEEGSGKPAIITSNGGLAWEVITIPEPAGQNCPAGGLKVKVTERPAGGNVSSGDVDEVIQYLCHSRLLPAQGQPHAVDAQDGECIAPESVRKGVNYACDEESISGALSLPAVCTSDGEIGCESSSRFPAVMAAELASKVPHGQVLAGIAGAFRPDLPDVQSVLSTDTVGGVQGSLLTCSLDGEVNCVTTGAFPAVEKSGLASKLILGQTAAAVAGAFEPDLPSPLNVRSSDTTGGVSGGLVDCATDGQLGCVSVLEFPSVQKQGLSSKLVAGQIAGGVTGIVTLPLANRVWDQSSFGASNSVSGALSLPMESSVLSGVAFGPDSSLLGTYNPDFPAISNLRTTDTSNGANGLVEDCSSQGEVGCFVVTGFTAQPENPHVSTVLKELGVKLWLDAADSSSVMETSGSVSQWSDKSGNGRHLTNADSGTRPALLSAAQNGLNVIQFAQGEGLEAVTPASDWNFLHSGNANGATVFVLGRFNEAQLGADFQQAFLSTSAGATANRGLFLAWSDYSGHGNRTFAVYVARGVLGTSNTLYSGDVNQAPSNTFLLGAISVFSDRGIAANRGHIYIDGVRSATNNSATATPSTGDAFSPLRIGWNTSNSSFTLSEYLIFDRVLEDEERQLVEGYFAHKWGTQSRLQAGHPYKVSPPAISFP